ncbi:hypothetical protein [Streptomyces rubiginosohelvolus]|uniref:hypothetical protein n=1 Tax=Streptomyces rubiginosohelvolus TaxID=67362 RepID=UPI00381AF5F2
MSKRSRRAAPGPGTALPNVAVCRGCCCGTPKIPGLDHTLLLRDLRRDLDDITDPGHPRPLRLPAPAESERNFMTNDATALVVRHEAWG